MVMHDLVPTSILQVLFQRHLNQNVLLMEQLLHQHVRRMWESIQSSFQLVFHDRLLALNLYHLQHQARIFVLLVRQSVDLLPLPYELRSNMSGHVVDLSLDEIVQQAILQACVYRLFPSRNMQIPKMVR